MTIAGFDFGGGVGVQVDFKIFFVCCVYGMSAIIVVIVQNSVGVIGFYELLLYVVVEQIEFVIMDIGVGAVKIGMLVLVLIMWVVVEMVSRLGILLFVVDLVVVLQHGDLLLCLDVLVALCELILLFVILVMFNLGEVKLLMGIDVRSWVDMDEVVRVLHVLGFVNVLVKGGYLFGDVVVDVFYDGLTFIEFMSQCYDI